MTQSSIGSRIRELRRKFRLTQRDIARIVGVSPSAVTQWEQDATTPSGESLLSLSKALDCPPEWIMTGKDAPSTKEPRHLPFNQFNVKEVPVISWDQAGQWTDPCPSRISEFPTIRNTNDTVFATVKVSDCAFALRTKGDSVTSVSSQFFIPKGSIVIVEPEYGHMPDAIGSLVVVQFGGTGEATIRKLLADGSIYYLTPLNPAFKTIEVNEDCRLIGVVKQIIINFDFN
ncbi:LexA family protein [Xenorhabdus bovienii]|uniref:LexA family protein n=1 Tax=Xenorhabdus bovienii TaxID=40576 RepID=UPI0023B303CF|nr:S24 family peptidase [Xenorhabdus bovienii]MDE9467510.1 helix-turn-helix domain-containing protein [Xenorhabdus bovienii]